MKFKGLIHCLPKKVGIVNNNIVVSMTSFPARILDVWMVVDSIFRQNMLPSIICLYLSEEDFPGKDEEIPPILKRYEHLGLRICWVPDNLKPHKKYFYSFQEFPDKCVITIDDDIFYRQDMIRNLWEIHIKYPMSVSANRVTPILDRDMNIKQYLEWGKGGKIHKECSFNYLAIGAGGILYPPMSLNRSCVFDVESIKKLSLNADDLWLKCHEILNSIPVSTGSHYPSSIEIVGSQRKSLKATNCAKDHENGNDTQWRKLNNHYQINQKLIELVKKELS